MLPHGRDARAVKERSRLAFTRISEGIECLSVQDCQRHLQRAAYAMPASHTLDETNHFLDAHDRVVLQSKCQRKKEHDLRIRAAGDFGKQVRRNGEHEIALDLMKS